MITLVQNGLQWRKLFLSISIVWIDKKLTLCQIFADLRSYKILLTNEKRKQKRFVNVVFFWRSPVFLNKCRRPTSNRASIRYGCPIRCFQFVRLQSKVSRIQTYSQALTFWLRMRVQIIGFKTIDRTTVSYRHSIMSISAF